MTMEDKVQLDPVESWAGRGVAILDRDAFAAWLASPGGFFTRDEVTFEPAHWGLVVSFAGRIGRTVIAPVDVAELTATVSRARPPVESGRPGAAGTGTAGEATTSRVVPGTPP